jgi:hypothetical protein
MNDEKELPFSKESTYESKDNRKNPRKWENKRKQINDKGLRIGGWLIPHKKTIGGFFLYFFMYFIIKNAMDMDMGSVKVRGVLLLIYIFL